MLNSIKNKPFKILWWTIPIVFVISLIKWNYSVDIQMHDTYFVIALFHVGILFILTLALIGGIYWLVRSKKLIDIFTIIHVTTTIILILVIMILFSRPEPDTTNMTLDSMNSDFESWKSWNQKILGGILAWTLSQLIFLVNLVTSLIRNEENLNV